MKTDMTEIKQVPLKDLAAATFNPRRLPSVDDNNMKELISSIRENGIIVPLTGRPTGKNGTIEIVAGGRRLLASKEAGLKTVPVIVRELTDVQAREVAIIDNLQREDVHPMQEALAYRDLLDKGGYDTKQVAAKVGKAEDYIYRRLVLCSLSEQAQEAFAGGKMLITHAMRVARLDLKYQEQILGMFIGPQIPAVYEVDRWIQNHVMVVLKNAPFKLEDANLVPSAGSCVKCPKRTGANSRLWDDVRGDDSCLDPDCFASKRTALVDQTRAKLAKAKGGFVEITLSYAAAPENPKALDSSKYSRAQKGECPHVTSGLVVDGYRDLGKVIPVCADKTCEVHHRRPAATTGTNKSPHDQMLVNQLDANIRSRVLLGILARFKALDHVTLEQICHESTRRLSADEQKGLWRIYDWEIPKGTFGHPPTGHLKKTFAQWSVPQLFSYLLAVSLISEVKLASYSTKHATYDGPLFDMAKRSKVPVDAIKVYCKAEAAARKLKGAKREAALGKLKRPDPAVRK